VCVCVCVCVCVFGTRQVDQRVFRRLVHEFYPRLAEHTEALGADVSCMFVQVGWRVLQPGLQTSAQMRCRAALPVGQGPQPGWTALGLQLSRIAPIPTRSGSCASSSTTCPLRPRYGCGTRSSSTARPPCCSSECVEVESTQLDWPMAIGGVWGR
jgi:hypothetical protein